MFESLFNKNEAPKVEEPGAPAETKRTLGIDPQTGTVMTGKEVADERKANLEDPTRRFDLK